MPGRKKIIYRPYDGSKPIKMSVPDTATEEQIHKKANEVLLQRSLKGVDRESELDSVTRSQSDKLTEEERPEREGLFDYLGEAGEAVLGGVGSVLEKLDQVSGANNIRSRWYDSLVEGHGKSNLKKNYNWTDFDSQKAATGKDIAQELGVTNTALSDVIPSLYSQSGDEWLKLKKGGFLDPTASGVAGVGIDMATDPFFLATQAGVLKNPAKAAKSAYAAMGQEMSGVPRRATRTFIEQKNAIPGERLLKSTAKDWGEKLDVDWLKKFGNSELRNETENLVRKYGDDFNSAAEGVTETANNRIKMAKSILGKDLEKALENRANIEINVDSAVKALDDVWTKLPISAAEEKKQILDLKEMLLDKNMVTSNGKISLKNADYLKTKLQDIATYLPDGKAVNAPDPIRNVRYAAKQSARNLRSEILNSLKEATKNPDLVRRFPEIVKYPKVYELYQRLHAMQRRTGMRSLLDEGKTSGAWFTGGSAESSQAFSNIKRLDKWLKDAGWDNAAAGSAPRDSKTLQSLAEDLGAYKYLGKPSFLPIDTTGKAVARQALGTTLGNVFKGALGGAVGGPAAGLSTFALTSPMTVKAGANLVRNTANYGGYVGARYENQRSRSGRPSFITRLSQKIAGTPYEQRFAEAAQKGEDSVNSEFFKSYLTDPDFQKLYASEQSNKEIDDLMDQELQDEQE